MAEKKTYIKFTTPAGVAIYPRVNKPDTKFKKEGVYSTKLAFQNDNEEFIAFVSRCTKVLAEFESKTLTELKADKKNAKKAATLETAAFVKEEEDDNGETTGRSLVNFKLNASFTNDKGETTVYSPKLFDAKNKPTTVSVWGGSVLKIGGTINPYYNAKDNQVGLSFRMNGVQILKLVSGTGGTAESYGFEADDSEGAFESDGFETADAATPAQPEAGTKPSKGSDF